MPNLDQIMSLVRAVLAIAGTILTTHGTINETMWQQIAGAVIILVPIVWGMFVQSDTTKLKAAAQVDGVERIVVSPLAHPDTAAGALAADPANPKVVVQ